MNNKLLIAGLFLVFLTVFLYGENAGEREPGEIVQITGVVRLVGNANFSELLISGAEREQWYITRNDRHILHDLQHRVVTVEGELTVHQVVLANGRLRGDRQVLHNIRIIEVKE